MKIYFFLSRILKKKRKNYTTLLNTSSKVVGAAQAKQTMINVKAKGGQGGGCLPRD